MDHIQGKANRMVHRRVSKRACTLYTSPKSTDTIQAFVPTTLTWDASCYTEAAGDGEPAPSAIDLYLYDATKPIMQWKDVPFQKGSLDATFDSSWWGNATTDRLHLQMVPTGSPLWATTVSSGPLFLAAYNGTYPTSAPSSSTTQVAGTNSNGGFTLSSLDLSPSHSGLSGSKLAAAVAVPLIVVFTGIFLYVLWSRFRTRKETKRYSAYVDDRMSAMNAPSWTPGSVGRPSVSSHRSMGSQGGNQRHSAAFSARHSAFLASLPQAHLTGNAEMTENRTGNGNGNGNGLLNPNRASKISFNPSERSSKRYSLAGGAGAMASTNRGQTTHGHGHVRGTGSTASALSNYSAHSATQPVQPSPLRNGTSPSPATVQRPLPSASGLRRQVEARHFSATSSPSVDIEEDHDDDELAVSPGQDNSPMVLAVTDVDAFPMPPASPGSRMMKTPSPSPSTPVPAASADQKRMVPGRMGANGNRNGSPKTNSVVSVNAELQSQLKEMGPAIQAIVGGNGNVGGGGSSERENEDRMETMDDSSVHSPVTSHRPAPSPPLTSAPPSFAPNQDQPIQYQYPRVPLRQPSQSQSQSQSQQEGKKFFGLGKKKSVGGGGGLRKGTIGEPQIVPGSNLDEARRSGVVTTLTPAGQGMIASRQVPEYRE